MLDILKLIFEECWNIDTCYPKSKDLWDEENKCLGQCAVTALIVNDFLGGEIRKCIVGKISHYYNFIDGKIVDLTKEQFKQEVINYEKYTVKNRNQIFCNNDVKRRYELLKTRVLNKLSSYNI